MEGIAKYCYGLIGKITGKHGLETTRAVLALLLVKSQIDNGHIKTRTITTTVSRICNISKCRVSRYVKIWVKLGLIKRLDNGDYRLTSYIKIWRKFGFNPKINKETKRVEPYRVASLSLNQSHYNLNNFETLLYGIDIYKSQKNQLYRQINICTRKIQYYNTKVSGKNNWRKLTNKNVEVIQETLKTLARLQLAYNSTSCSGEAFIISCKRIATKFGKKTPMSGLKIEKRIKEQSLFSINKTKPILIAAGVKRDEFFYSSQFNKPGYFWLYGKVFNQLCNELRPDLISGNIRNHLAAFPSEKGKTSHKHLTKALLKRSLTRKFDFVY